MFTGNTTRVSLVEGRDLKVDNQWRCHKKNARTLRGEHVLVTQYDKERTGCKAEERETLSTFQKDRAREALGKWIESVRVAKGGWSRQNEASVLVGQRARWWNGAFELQDVKCRYKKNKKTRCSTRFTRVSRGP